MPSDNPSEIDQFADKKAPFVLGNTLEPASNLPLGRFLPPYFEGQVSEWVKLYAPQESWVLDPFGQDPYADLELARAGYRVLVSANNPIAAFMLEALSLGAAKEEWSDALLTIANLPMQGKENFESWLTDLYSIPCPTLLNEQDGSIFPCGGIAQVQRFIWSGDDPTASTAEVFCPDCGTVSQIELTAEHHKAFNRLPSFTLYRARALELLSGPQDELRPVIEDVIQYYTPRALVLLQLLLNKLESTDLPNRVRMLTQALFLSAADRMNVLWAFPLGKNRPKQLTTPPSYEEMNLWLALQEVCQQWQAFTIPVELKKWPDMPSRAGGICLFSGRLREMQPFPKEGMIDLVYSSLPRRNQAWWNLSGLWTGWLWGKEAVEPLRHSLIRQRYDWNWHAMALQKVLGQLQGFIQPQNPILLQISELDSKFLLASLEATSASNLKIRGFAANGTGDQLQISLRKGSKEKVPLNNTYWPDLVRSIAAHFLITRSEPAPYLPLLTAVALFLHDQGRLEAPQPSDPPNLLGDIERSVQEILGDTTRFERFNSGMGFDTGTFWLRQSPVNIHPLADRSEGAILQEIYQNPSFTLPELLNAVYRKTKGLNNPEFDLTAAVLQSYAEPEDQTKQRWCLKPGEGLPERAEDLRQIEAIITELATQLGYSREIRPSSILWFDEAGKNVFSFFPISNAIITPLLLANANDTSTKLIVVPGSRANLIAYKLKHDPNLQRLLTPDWQIIKFQQLHLIKDNSLLTRELFASQLLTDLPEFHTVQLHLL
jgi:hypothetical protein